MIRAGDPRSFLLYGSAIKLNLLEEKKPAMVWEAKYKGCPWLETPEMKRWREEELPKAEGQVPNFGGPYKAWQDPVG